MLTGLIGGTGLNAWEGLELIEERVVPTPYGAPSSALRIGRLQGAEVCFLARHGDGHKLPPHRINYRANLWALHSAGVEQVIAIAAVGSMDPRFDPGKLALPHDLIDYTWGRDHSYSDGPDAELMHVEFTQPYDPALREGLIASARDADVGAVGDGIMAVTQGPRLESAAEIQRLLRDGCTMVGMTGMPEAALARELGMAYACLAVSVNWAAGMGEGAIHAQIDESIATGMSAVRRTVSKLLL